MGVRAELGDYTISLKTDSEPYRLIINFKNAHDTSRDEWFDLTAIRYSCVLMALIDNAGEVAWTCPGSDKKGSDRGIFYKGRCQKSCSAILRWKDTANPRKVFSCSLMNWGSVIS